jgi:hypothetical protein
MVAKPASLWHGRGKGGVVVDCTLKGWMQNILYSRPSNTKHFHWGCQNTKDFARASGFEWEAVLSRRQFWVRAVLSKSVDAPPTLALTQGQTQEQKQGRVQVLGLRELGQRNLEFRPCRDFSFSLEYPNILDLITLSNAKYFVFTLTHRSVRSTVSCGCWAVFEH